MPSFGIYVLGRSKQCSRGIEAMLLWGRSYVPNVVTLKRSFAKQGMIKIYLAKDLLLARKIQTLFYGYNVNTEPWLPHHHSLWLMALQG